MSGKRRVVVTGLGAVSPVGNSISTMWKALIEGQSGIAPISRFDASAFDSKIAGEVKGFNPDDWIPKKEQKKMDTFIHFAVASAKMAMDDSGFQITEANAERVAVIVGAGIGGLPAIETQHTTLTTRGPGRITPFFIPMVIGNLAGGQVSIMFGAKGPNTCITTACSSGAHSIGEAFRYIRDGYADAAIAGGSEAVVCPLAVGGFSAMRALSTRNDNPQGASRPFDKDRDGFVIGEGAGIMVLEELEAAQKRGARIYCEVAGYGLSSDGYHMTNPSEGGEGAARCMRLAMQDAQLTPDKIGYVNAHGTSTGAGDVAETLALKSVFKDQASKVWVSSTKSMIGHLLGAAGGIEAVISVLALRDGIAPPTINLDNPDPQCDLDYVPKTSRQKRFEAVLSNSFGFGGTNASLIFKRGP